MIEDAIAGHPDLYLEHCVAMAVALMSSRSELSCEFDVACNGFSIPALGANGSFQMRVRWTNKTLIESKRIRHTEQTNPIVERASIAMAALLFGHLIPDSGIRVTKQGERADYWLPNIECALEVSGTTNEREMKHRCRAKRTQVLANPLGWNGHAIVCCFGESHRRIDWSFHEQPSRRTVK